MAKDHSYNLTIRWTGNLGEGTSAYRAYSRNHEIVSGAKPPILASSDPAFRGDDTRYNPEELLVAALSSCHMLWALHLFAVAGIVVVSYEDNATGTMRQNAEGSGEFTQVTLHPRMTITDASRIDEAAKLHHRAHELCFVARSVNFPVGYEPEITST